MAENTEELVGLRELAERLLVMQGPFAVAQPSPELFPGRLPDGLPLDLPLLAGSRVIGSVRRDPPPMPGGAGVSGRMTEIVLDVPGSAEDVLRFYEQEMPARGWPRRENDAPPRPGGFTPVPMRPGLGFSQAPDGPVVSVRAMDLAAELSDVRIHIGAAGVRPPAPPMRPPGFGVLPSLAPPQGVVLHPLGGGGGGSVTSSTAIALTDQSSEALEAHFAQQFQAAGWTRTDGGTNGPMAWSSWTSEAHEGWAGLLLVVEEPAPNQRLLHARVNQAGADWLRAPAGWVGTVGPYVRF